MASLETLSVTIKANTTSARNSVDKLSASLVKLQGALNSVGGTPLTMLSSRLGQLSKNASSASSGFKIFGDGSQRAARSTTSLAGTLGKLYAGFWLLRRGVGAVGNMIDVASDLTEVENVVDNTFYGMRGVLDDFVQDSTQKFGMAELSAKTYASRFQAMGMAMGITGDQVQNATNFLNGVPTSMEGVAAGYDAASDSLADMSLNLTKLTADMASFYNTGQGEIASALQSGVMAGQSRALRQYGLDLTQATLQEYALAHGLNADMSAMTQAEKTLLRYQYVMANTANIQGDFERTAGSWHNQVVQLKQAYQQLSAVIGTGLINAFKPFLSGLNSILQAVTSFAEQVLNALGKIFGWEVEISASGISDSLGGAAEAAGDLADNAGGTGGGLKNAGKEADKLKRKLLSFDELHVLDFGEQKDPSSGGGGGGGGGGAGGGGGGGAADGAVTASIKSTKKMFESDIDSLYELGYRISTTLRDMLRGIDWEEVYQGARDFGFGLASFLNGLIRPDTFYEIGRTIANALNTAFEFVLSFARHFNWSNLGLSIASGINGFVENLDIDKAADAINTFVEGVWDTVITAIDNINWEEIADKIGQAFFKINWLAIIGLVIVSKVPHMAKMLLGALAGKITAYAAGILGPGLAEAFALAAGGAGTLFEALAATIGPVVTVIGTVALALGGAVAAVWSFVSQWNSGFSMVKSIIMVAGIAVLAFVAVVAGVPALIAAAVAGIIAVFAVGILWIKSNWESVKQFFADLWDGICEYFEGFAERWNKGWTAICEFFEDRVGFIGESFVKVIGFFADLGEKGTEHGEAVRSVFEKLPGTFENFKEKAADALGSMGKSVAGARGVTEVSADGIRDSLSKGWGPVSSKIGTTFSGIGTDIKSSLDSAKSDANVRVDDIKAFFTDGWSTAKSGVKSTFDDFKSNMSDKMSTAKDNVANHVKSIQNKFTTGWASATSSVKTTFDGFQKNMSNAIDTASNNIDKAIGSIKRTFNGIKLNLPKIGMPSNINSIGSSITGALSSAVSYIKNLSWTLPRISLPAMPHLTLSWGEIEFRGKKLRYPNGFDVNYYATGGFPEEGPFYMNRGEIAGRFSNGKSVVANNQQIIEGIKQGVMEALISADSRSGGDSPVIEFTLKAGEDTLYRAVRRGEQKYNRRFSATATV